MNYNEFIKNKNPGPIPNSDSSSAPRYDPSKRGNTGPIGPNMNKSKNMAMPDAIKRRMGKKQPGALQGDIRNPTTTMLNKSK